MAFHCERLQKVEEETRHLHWYLEPGDICYFLGEYTSNRDYAFSDFNQLIKNLKKKPRVKAENPRAYYWKEQDIKRVGQCMRHLVQAKALEEDLTLVPVPPSKTRTHPDYDDRMLQICKEMVSGLRTPDVRELINSTVDLEPTHNQEKKPKPEELIQTYDFVAEPGYQPRPYTLLVDDMLTTGSHFKACKQLISRHFPNTMIVGLFVTRRIFPETSVHRVFGLPNIT